MDLIRFDNNSESVILKKERWRYPRFFAPCDGKSAVISGDDAKHITTVLRTKKGEYVVICDGAGVEYLAELTSNGKDYAEFKIIDSRLNKSEADIYVRLFEGVPKSDKLEYIVQKATELGVSEIVPTFTKRCTSRPDEKNQARKRQRMQKIAEEAAKQSGRGKIPKISEFTTFNFAISEFNQYKNSNLGIILYECGGEKINDVIKNTAFKNIDIFIGSEGGFEESEITFANDNGVKTISLGERILRTETAPVAILSILMNLTGNL